MAGHRRPAGSDGCGSAVELRDTETPDFLLVGRFEREQEALLLLTSFSLLSISRV
jgi:hypothetical protein